MIIKSEKNIYDSSNGMYDYPVYELDTEKRTVVYTDPVTYERTATSFNTDFARHHLRYVEEHDIGRLKKLVNEGRIIDYLDEFEDKCFELVDSQVEKWKADDKEYQVAILNGNIVLAAGLANNMVLRAKEIANECIVYR